MSQVNGRPRWKLESERRRAQAAHELVSGDDRAVIEPRLSPGCLERFETDMVRLDQAKPEALQVLASQKSATVAEHVASAEGHDLIMQVRESAKRRAPADQVLHKALGIGDNLKAADTDAVLAMLYTIVKLAGDNRKGLERIGVLQSDVEEAQALAKTLAILDKEQRRKKASRVVTTSERTAVRLAIEAAVDEIAAAGKLSFRKDPNKRARYEALLASIVGEEEAEAEPEPPAEEPPQEEKKPEEEKPEEPT